MSASDSSANALESTAEDTNDMTGDPVAKWATGSARSTSAVCGASSDGNDAGAEAVATDACEGEGEGAASVSDAMASIATSASSGSIDCDASTARSSRSATFAAAAAVAAKRTGALKSERLSSAIA